MEASFSIRTLQKMSELFIQAWEKGLVSYFVPTKVMPASQILYNTQE